MPTIKMPATAVMGMKNPTRLEKSRAFRMDHDPEKFVDQIEIKGYRLAWSRASECPCEPNNAETKQPDINCPLCKGRGWLYFRPANYIINMEHVGKMNPLQTLIATAADTVVIRGIMTGLQTKTDQYDKVGRWIEGTSSVTVRPENRLGYHDRITNLDSTIVFSETVELAAGALTVKTRYPVVGVNLLRTMSKAYEAADFDIVKGVITWIPNKGPTTKTRISVHYLMHPAWIIIEHPKSIRDMYIQKKLNKKKLDTPIGNLANLPINAVIKYDFLL